ncbi:MAG: M28 family peptidase [Gammaproteobacteria bacterium]|nr:M28 family peptidase [Gammaproteobacteria bacterium]
MTSRRLGRALLILLGLGMLVGIMFVTSMPGTSYRGALPSLSPEQLDLRDRLHTHVGTLAGAIGERNLYRYAELDQAAQYVSDTFHASGYQVIQQAFNVNGKTVKNLEVLKEGLTVPNEIIVVGAHYDSVFGSPGANDNATGVGTMLELARLLTPQRLARSVRFVAFVNEEPPYTYTEAMGSRRYVERAVSRGENIIAMLSLETIGYYSEEDHSQHYPFPFALFYPHRGDFIGFVGNLRSRNLVRQAINSFRRHAKFPSEGCAAPGWITGIGWSDHWSFWKAGYSAIMVTDTALFRYSQYHSAADRPEIIDYERLARVADGLASVVVDLASSD